MSLDPVEGQVDRRIREMAEAGELSGLPGEGAPLPHDPDEDAGERWAARHVTRNGNAAPAWADLRKEIDAAHARVLAKARRHLAWLDARAERLVRLPAERIVESTRTTAEIDRKVRGEIDAEIAELNALVRRYCLVVPVASLQLSPFTAERVFALAREEAG
jgi:hypothetical protein